MGIFRARTPTEIELERLARQEQKFMERAGNRQEPHINRLLNEKVPEKLRDVLDAAFIKAFVLVFEKGTAVIEKTYDRDKLEKGYLADSYAAEVKGDRRSLRVFSQKAGNSGRKNLLLSGSSGIGLGVLGVGIPDIPLFTGLMLKGIYEIALQYGFEYDSDGERCFILLLIQGALSYGEEIRPIDREINAYIVSGQRPPQWKAEELIRRTAGCLADELLYMKFLQGIPLIGAVGGAYDAVYMKRILAYAELKYRRRFYYGRRKG